MQKLQIELTKVRFRHMWLPMLYLLAATIFLPSCGDGPSTLGKDVLPAEDIIGMKFTDTVQVEMETQLVERVNTFRASRQLFGNYVDPQFGRISATTFAEVLPRSGLNFGDAADLMFDSLTITMELESVYGSPDEIQTLRIHELQQIIPDVDEIFSDQSLPYDQDVDLGDGFQINFDPSQGTQTFTVRLSDELGRRILFGDPDTLADKDKFKELFKGFAFMTKPVTFLSREPGAIYLFVAGGTASQMQLHYQKKDENGAFQAASPEPFLISSSTPRFHSIEREDAANKLLTLEVDQPDSKTLYEFNQGGSVIKNFIRFPHIGNLGVVGVSRAELILKVDTAFNGSIGQFVPPIEMLAIQANENKDELLDADGFRVPIESTSSSALYDPDKGTYTFSITEYVQRLSAGQLENNGFILVARNASFQINRAVLGGASHPTLKPVLNITFSTLPR